MIVKHELWFAITLFQKTRYLKSCVLFLDWLLNLFLLPSIHLYGVLGFSAGV